MNSSSLNHVFRLIWSARVNGYVPVAEVARSARKGGRSATAAKIAAVILGGAASAQAVLAAPAGLPTGAQLVSGTGSLSQTQHTLVVNQTSQKLVSNWQTFDIAAGNTVVFNQPSTSAIALNRVLGSDVSLIQGELKANGQVFLLNPNGILFSPTAQVNTAGLLVSTLNLSDENFKQGNLRFTGDSTASVSNAGQLSVASGGTLALLAAKVINTGTLTAESGQVLVGAGSDITLDIGGPTQLQINRGVLDGLINNGGAIKADGGTVLLTAKSADLLSQTVINNRGLIQAQTLTTGAKGEILLLGDMTTGSLNIGGTLDARALVKGDGGHIETSAATVNTLNGLQVNAGSRTGRGGDWLVDPYNYTIDSTAAANIVGALNSGTSVTVSTQANSASYGSAGSSAGSGDITVSSPITKSSGGDATLSLHADRDIVVNSAITSTSGKLGINLSSANNASSAVGGVTVAANLVSNGGDIFIGGAGGNVQSAKAYGIGFALNNSSGGAAVEIGTNVDVNSGGGNIVINGQTNATTSTYSPTKAGVYVMSGATVESGGGNIYISANSTGDAKEFAFGAQASSGTTTTFKTSTTSGGIFVDATNTLNAQGSLGLTNNGSQANIQFWAPSVAYFLFRLNGSNQAASFTQKSPCNPGYPNCGTMVIPGGNQSYTEAAYNVVSMALLPIYVFTGNGSRIYDGMTDTTGLTVTSLGGPTGFTTSQLGTLGFSTPSKNVGAYTSLVSSSSNPASYSSGTYAVGYFNQGTYTVTPKSLTNFQAANKVYDGTTAASMTATGLVSGDNVTLHATGGFAQSDVGTGLNVNVTAVSLSGADAGNYSIPSFSAINTTANITQAPLLCTANNASKTYDGTTYSGGNGVTYSGFVNGQTSSVLSGSLSYTGSSQTATNVGTYAITPQGLSSSNYALSFVNGTLTIVPAGLTLVTGSLTGVTSKVYDGTTAATLAPGNFLLSGFVNGDGASVTKTSGTYANANVGTSKLVTVDLASGDFSATGSTNLANYQLPTTVTGSIGTISQAPLTVTANNTSKTYNAQAYTGGAGVSYSGFVNGETNSVLGGTLAYSGSSQGAVNAGSYTITPQGLSSGNYAITFSNGALTVNPAALTLTATANTKTYDGNTTATATPTVSGLLGSDSISGLTEAYGNKNAGTGKSVSVTGYTVNDGNNGGNYTVTTVANNASVINKADASVSGTATQLVYNGTNQHQAAASTQGFINGDDITVSGLASGKNAGSYNSSLTVGGNDAGNYNVTVNDAALVISKAALTLTAAANTKTYDGNTTAAAAPTVSGLLGSDSVSGLIEAYGNKNAGTGKSVSVTGYTVNDGNNGANYTVTTVANNASVINKADASVSGTATQLVYNGTNQHQAAASTQGFINGDDITVSGVASGKNAGSYNSSLTVGGNDAGNYNVTVTDAALVIGKAALTLSAAANTKTYDGNTTAAATPTVSGLLGSDSISGLIEAYGNKNAGTGKSVSVTGYTVNDGNNGGNYTVTTVANNASLISPAELLITITPTHKSSGSSNPGFTAAVTGFVGGESLASAAAGVLSFVTKASSDSVPGSYSVTGTGLSAVNGNYVFVQAPGNAQALTVTEAPVNASEFLPKTAPVPNFPDNAQPALGTQPARVGASNLNYVPVATSSVDASVASPLNASAAQGASASTTASASGSTPDRGTLSLATTGSTPPTVADAGANGIAPAGTGVAANFAAQGTPTSTPDATAAAGSSNKILTAGVSAGAGASTGPSAGDVNAPDTADSASKTKTAKLGVAGVAVPSANGPLDVFVIDGGINAKGKQADKS